MTIVPLDIVKLDPDVPRSNPAKTRSVDPSEATVTTPPLWEYDVVAAGLFRPRWPAILSKPPSTIIDEPAI
jgi:hypothetical protein